ncbi:MAG: SIS domain-containing protein, partial [Candidatus Woesebacteria bacterium]|nr:SIS domain-containing protein [Candidatus Woesebacteria bacterium]
MNLNKDYTKLDPSGVEKALTLFPDQIKSTHKQVQSTEFKVFSFDNVVVSGMGGSSNAGKIIQGILEDNYNKLFFVYNDYDLPAWVNKNTLVIVNSYSGNTEESLSGYAKAKEIGCQTIGISTGGKINDVILDPKDTNPTGYPKTGLGISLGGLLGVLHAIGIMPNAKEELDIALIELEEVRKTWNAKEMA